MNRFRARGQMQTAGVALALHALVSLILFSTAVAHCLPRIGHHQADHHQVKADPSRHDGHHAHTEHAPFAPEQQDDCCGILCRTFAGHAFAPVPDPAPAAILTYQTQDATAPDERPIATRRRSVLPLGSRAPPVAA